MRRAEHALDHAHGAADPSADRAPDDAADRARDPAAFIGSLLRAAHDALGVTGARRQEQCKQDDSHHEDERQRQEGRPRRALSLGFLHFDLSNLSPGAFEFEPAVRPNGCTSVANSRLERPGLGEPDPTARVRGSFDSIENRWHVRAGRLAVETNGHQRHLGDEFQPGL
jgi:hypothetical protein